MEAIILAGGFGKRLQDKVVNAPKPMAPVNNRPFLDYLMEYLLKQDISKIFLSVYHKYEMIKSHYNNSYKTMEIYYSIDKDKLGTGGAIKNAISITNDDHVFIINGDTYFDVNLSELYKKHVLNQNDITLSLKPMQNFDRYGIVNTATNGQVLSLEEKQFRSFGTIDGGIYMIKRNLFKSINTQNQFSFNDFIRDNLNKLKVGSLCFDELFIDIGTPEDYEKAQKVLRNRIW